MIEASGVTYDPGETAGECVYDRRRADKVVRFFERALIHTKGTVAGKPFKLESWQEAVTRNLFGWVRPDGTRRYRQTYVTVPRKNGKTTWSAGLASYVLACEPEARAENYCAGTDRLQAALLYQTVAAMFRKNPTLMKHAKVIDSQHRITWKGSFLRAIPANEGASHGFDIYLVIGDELHAWPGRAMYDVLTTGTGSREQPLTLWITTAGYDRQSICWSEYTYAKGVRDGKIDDPYYLPVIYEADEQDDWQSEDVWRKSNPNFGVSLREDYIRREAKKAVDSPGYENTFRRLHCNQWTSQSTRWLSMDKWRSCRCTSDAIPAGSDVWAGLDLSEMIDLSAWCALSKSPSGDWRARWQFFMPQGQLAKRERLDRAPYSQWAERGWLTAIPGTRIDLSWIEQYIVEESRQFNLKLIGYDPYHASQMVQNLESIYGIRSTAIRPGFNALSFPSKALEGMVAEGELDHGNNPLMDWMAEAVEIKTDPKGNIMPCRPSRGSAQKIDGVAALVNAIAAAQTEQDSPVSIYETRGPIVV